MPFLAGQKIRASDLNDRLAIYGIATVDVSRTSNTTLQDVTGMLAALEAGENYALDGYIAYDAGATGDLKMSLTVPAGVTGSWGIYGLGTATTGGVGDISCARADAFGDANTLAIGGSASPTTLVAQIRGTLTVAATAGNAQFRMAQNTSNGTASTVKQGSWFRLMKILTS